MLPTVFRTVPVHIIWQLIVTKFSVIKLLLVVKYIVLLFSSQAWNIQYCDNTLHSEDEV